MEPGSFITQFNPRWIAQGIIGVCQEQMRGSVAVFAVDRASCLAHRDLCHPVFLVQLREIGASNRSVLIQRQSGAIDATVVVQFLRFLQITDAFVEAIVLLVQKRGIEPRGRIGGIEVFGELELVQGASRVACVSIGLAQIATQQRTLWFERGGHQQIFAPAVRVASADAAQTASEPGVSEGRVHTDGLAEPVDGFAGLVLRSEQEAFQCQRLGIARTQFEAFVQAFQREIRVPETEFQLGHPRPGKTKLRRLGRRLPREVQRRFQ